MKTDTTIDATATTETPAAAPAPKVAKSFTVTLNANGSVLQLVAERTAAGAKSYVLTTTDKKTTRGMTETHQDFEAAKLAIGTRAAQAEKLGWTRKIAGRVFTAKPDAFTSLPTAPKAAPSPKAVKK